MEKDIRFCANADGDAIAYTRFGRGPLLVVPPGWVSHLSKQWELPGVNRFFTKLARHHTLLFFDKHGTGLSDRNRTDFSLQKDVRDLEHLIEAVGAERFSVFGYSMGGPLAVSYAARNPDRIDKLILYGTFAEGDAVSKQEVRSSMISLVRASWGMGASLLSWLFVPHRAGDPDAIQKISAFQRQSASAETAANLLDLFHRIDVTESLPDLRVPTLVIHRRNDKAIPHKHGQKLAMAIPGAHFQLIEGDIHFPWLGDTDTLLAAILEFLGDKPLSDAETMDLKGGTERSDGPETHTPASNTGVYRLTYRDFLGDAPRVQQTTGRVGIAQIYLESDILEEVDAGLFGFRQSAVDVMGQKIGKMIAQAVDHRINILVFPEMTVDMNYPDLSRLIFEAAEANDMMIIPGSFHNLETRRNVSRVIGPEGILWEQEKHIPAVIRLNGDNIREGIIPDPEKKVVIANTRFGRIAVAICRDFLDMDLRVELKHFSPPVDIIVNPALTPVTQDFGAAHLEARRSLYAYFFFCNVAQFGHSQIHSPEKGRKKKSVAQNTEKLIFKDIDLFNLRAERRKWEKIRDDNVRFIQSTR